MEKEKYLKGVWTPWAKLYCFTCHGNENLPNPKTEEEWRKVTKPQELKYGNDVTFCDDCGVPIQVEESVAREHNLVAALRERGFDAELRQTGGMMSACGIEPSDLLKGAKGPDDVGEILVTYNDGGDNLYWMGVYDNDFSPLDPEWANVTFKSQDEVIKYVYQHQEKFAKLEQPDLEQPGAQKQGLQKSPDQGISLAALMGEAKERATEKGTAQDEKKPPGAREPER